VLIGNEGMFGASLALGIDVSPVQALVRGPGSAWRIDAAPFRRELAGNTALRRVLNRYVHVLMTQLAQTAACTKFHLVEARLARLLLMTQDEHTRTLSISRTSFSPICWAFAVLVSPRPPGCCKTKKLISYNRGHITILDSDGLESISCECYRPTKKRMNTCWRRPIIQARERAAFVR